MSKKGQNISAYVKKQNGNHIQQVTYITLIGGKGTEESLVDGNKTVLSNKLRKSVQGLMLKIQSVICLSILLRK